MEKETLYYNKANSAGAEAKLKALSEAGESKILPMDDIPEWQQK